MSCVCWSRRGQMSPLNEPLPQRGGPVLGRGLSGSPLPFHVSWKAPRGAQIKLKLIGMEFVSHMRTRTWIYIRSHICTHKHHRNTVKGMQCVCAQVHKHTCAWKSHVRKCIIIRWKHSHVQFLTQFLQYSLYVKVQWYIALTFMLNRWGVWDLYNASSDLNNWKGPTTTDIASPKIRRLTGT